MAQNLILVARGLSLSEKVDIIEIILVLSRFQVSLFLSLFIRMIGVLWRWLTEILFIWQHDFIISIYPLFFIQYFHLDLAHYRSSKHVCLFHWFLRLRNYTFILWIRIFLYFRIRINIINIKLFAITFNAFSVMHATIRTHSFEIWVLTLMIFQIKNAKMTDVIRTTFRDKHQVEVSKTDWTIVFVICFFLFVCWLEIAEINVFFLVLGIQNYVGLS